MSEAEYEVYVEDLLHYRIEDIELACTQLGQELRREGETAFPAVRTIQERIWAIMRERRERLEREKAEAERQYMKDHPEEFSPFDFKAALDRLAERGGIQS